MPHQTTCPHCKMVFQTDQLPDASTCPVCGNPFDGPAAGPGWAGSGDPAGPERFRNPLNGHVEELGTPWVWCLLFGPFYFAVKGVWSHVLIGLVLAMVSGGLSWLAYPFFAKSLLRTHYLKRGWIAEGGSGQAQTPELPHFLTMEVNPTLAKALLIPLAALIVLVAILARMR